MSDILANSTFFKLCLDLTSKVNHDLLGSLHVASFCIEELEDFKLSDGEQKIGNYVGKLKISFEQFNETIQLSRRLINTLKTLVSEGRGEVSLCEAIQMGHSLALLYGRHNELPALRFGTQTKKMKSVLVADKMPLIMMFFFEALGRNQQSVGDVVIDDLENCEMIQFSIMSGVFDVQKFKEQWIPAKHQCMHFFTSEADQKILQTIVKERDIIGLLRSENGIDHFYFHTELIIRHLS